MKRKVFMLTLTLLMVFFFLSGCSNEEQNEHVVKVGYFPNITHGPALVGFGEKRFEKKFGSEVKLEEKIFTAGPALMEALIAGEVDIGYVGPIPAINGFVQGARISVIAGANNGGAVLVAGKNSGINSPADLSGKKVAIPQFANTQDITLRQLLNEYSLKDKTKGGTVDILQVAPADMGLLISQSQIDAALVPEPWGTQLMSDFDAKLILDWNQVWNNGNYPTTIIIARNEFIDENPEFIQKWLDVHKEIVNYINLEPDKAMDTIARQIQKISGKSLPLELLKTSMGKCRVTTEVDRAVMKEFAALSYETGYLKTNPDLAPMLSYLNSGK